jgi:hypothetical protein
MRYRMVAKVEGDIYTSETVLVERGELLFEFRSDESGRLAEIAVSIQVPIERIGKFASAISPGRGESAVTITLGGDAELYRLLVTELQVLESNLAFASIGSLRQVNWKNPEQEFIPENAAEEKLISIPKYSRKQDYRNIPVSMDSRRLVNLVTKAPEYNTLYIPKAFWREGMNYFTNFQYIQAFYCYYFVVEESYAGGKTGEKPTLQEFAKSKEFAGIIENALEMALNEDQHGSNLKRMFKEQGCEVSIHGLQKLIFRVRGNLHHYSSKGSNLRGTPFNQDRFESIAFLMQYIAALAIGYREANISQSKANKPSAKAHGMTFS